MTIVVEQAEHIAHVILNRAEKRNALTSEMLSTLEEALRSAARDSEVRVVILRANGPDFCAGFDLSRLKSEELAEERMAREEEELYNRGLALRNLPKPTIAAVQGGCIAGGLLLSQMCDLIVASDDAYFYNPLVRMGGVALELLMEPWDVGIRRAKRYLFTGERIPADVALKFGMITDLVSRDKLLAATTDIAKKISAMPPTTIRLLKKSLNRTQDLMGMRASLDYHFAMHEFGHTTREFAAVVARSPRAAIVEGIFRQARPRRPREMNVGGRAGRRNIEFGFMMGLSPREPIGRFAQLAQLAESVGFDMAWMADSQLYTKDPWVALTLAASATKRIRTRSWRHQSGHPPFHRHDLHCRRAQRAQRWALCAWVRQRRCGCVPAWAESECR